MTALCKNDLSSDLNSTFGFRFFANKLPPRLALRVFSHAHKLLNFDGTRGSRCQAPMGDPREKKPSIPIHRKRGGRVYRFRTIWNLMELYNKCLWQKRIIRIPITQLMWRIEGPRWIGFLFLANLNQRLIFSYTRKFDLGQSKNWARRCKR